MVNQTSPSFAAETKKGFLLVSDRKDGYSFVYPFGWQEVVIGGQDKLDADGKVDYTTEFVAQAPNFTRHVLGAITTGNGMEGVSHNFTEQWIM
ncbi:hypothetical protein OIU77_012637 [Salix suchowensis]|uniref:PsbP C-terminal domain-containing protein n=1 Tax=Salix suchowensis TaxID=1278906 RepID=A0ABQ9A4H5_9ROSI|nr:hypothetical protein OIU77_012637 [Salix suchowensis]